MKKAGELFRGRKNVQLNFFKEFSKYHRAWMKELITAYKERGQFPFLPVFIANYYERQEDKETALIATLLLDWNGNVMKQMKALRELMGEHPYKWFKKRGFVLLSIGKNQEDMLATDEGRKYWKVARFFSMLYDTCNGRSLKRTFPAGRDSSVKTRLVKFASEVGVELGDNKCEYKAEVIELVLRASDGISIGLWPTEPQKIKCPCNAALLRCMKTWFPDYTKTWTWDGAISVFELEYNYDFFYYHLAWEALRKVNSEECKLYSTRYINRYNNGCLLPPSSWIGCHGRMPEIKFE